MKKEYVRLLNTAPGLDDEAVKQMKRIAGAPGAYIVQRQPLVIVATIDGVLEKLTLWQPVLLSTVVKESCE